MSGETVGRPMEILLVEDSLTAARLAIGALKKAPVPHRLTWLRMVMRRLNSCTAADASPAPAAGPDFARSDVAEKGRPRVVGRNQVGRRPEDPFPWSCSPVPPTKRTLRKRSFCKSKAT